jgi:uncharacterized protein (DUF58 family)
METTELLKKVRKIEIKTKGLSNDLFSGEYHSSFKGRGMSFSEVREYQYGDDIRSIDWNVTARFNHPYVKIFEEERELTVILMVDVSRSALFGSQQQIKREIITEICAVLAFSAINNNDKVGVIFFSDTIEKFIPPKKGRSHILMIIRELLHIEPVHAKTDISQAIQYFNRVIKKRSIAFLLSDFIDDQYNDALNIAGRKHDLIGLRIYDPRDMEIPPIGLVHLQDAETGMQIWVDFSNKKVRSAYFEKQNNYAKYFEKAFLKIGKDKVSIRVDQPYVKALIKLFNQRGR